MVFSDYSNTAQDIKQSIKHSNHSCRKDSIRVRNNITFITEVCNLNPDFIWSYPLRASIYLLYDRQVYL